MSGRSSSSAVVDHPAAVVAPLDRVQVAERPVASSPGTASGIVTRTLSRVGLGFRSLFASSSTSAAARGSRRASRAPRRQGGDEQAQVVALVVELVRVRDQHQLVVVGHAEPVHRDDPGPLPALAQLHALDVPERAQRRVDLARQHRGQQARAHVRDLHRGLRARPRGAGSSSGRPPGRGCRPCRRACRAGRAPSARPTSAVAISEVSGRCTSAATATTGSPCSRASSTSGS